MAQVVYLGAGPSSYAVTLYLALPSLLSKYYFSTKQEMNMYTYVLNVNDNYVHELGLFTFLISIVIGHKHGVLMQNKISKKSMRC